MQGTTQSISVGFYEGTLLITYTAYSEIWSLHLTVPEEQWAATAQRWGPTPDSEPVPRSRVLTGDTPKHCWASYSETVIS